MRQVVEESGIAAEIETQSRSSAGSLAMLLQYKEWADRIAFEEGHPHESFDERTVRRWLSKADISSR